ncbi:hypothetical protein Tco_1395371, partial [Tanacetum coccineum]
QEGYRNAIKLPEGAKIPLTLMVLQELPLVCVYSNFLFVTKLSIGLIVCPRDISQLGMILPLVSLHSSSHQEELLNFILMFKQHQDESLCNAWTRFKDLLRKVPHHGLDLWLQVQIFYDHVDYTTQMAIDYTAGERLRKLRPEEAWETIKDLAQYEEEEWNEQIFSKKESPYYIDVNLE